MLGTRVIPCLLLERGRLVKTVKFGNPTYLGDPVNVVKIFNEKTVDELVLLDIAATRERRPPDLSLLSTIAGECFVPLAYGGGIRDLDSIRRLIGLGFEKAIVNTFAVEHPEFVEAAALEFGSQSIVVAIDVLTDARGGYQVLTHGGRTRTSRDVRDFAREMAERGAGEILVNSIDRDGTMQGYDVALIRQVAEAVRIPVIACGGARTLDDLAAAVHEGGASAAAAGSMFVFQGRHRAVLISFPREHELRRVFPDRDPAAGAAPGIR